MTQESFECRCHCSKILVETPKRIGDLGMLKVGVDFGSCTNERFYSLCIIVAYEAIPAKEGYKGKTY